MSELPGESTRVKLGITSLRTELGSHKAGALLSDWAVRQRRKPFAGCHDVDLLLPSDIVGLEHALLGHRSHVVVAPTELRCWMVDGPVLATRLREDPDRALDLLKHGLSARHRLDSQLLNIGGPCALNRVINFLLDLHERLAACGLVIGSGFGFPMAQPRIGNCLGLTTMSINRCFRRLRDEGVLAMRGRWVEISERNESRRRSVPGRAFSAVAAL